MFGAFVGGFVIGVLLLLYNPLAALIFLIYFIVYQTIANNVVVPNIFAKTVDISPLTVLLATIVGTYCGGFIGIFIAIPVAGCLQILLREWLVARKIETEAEAFPEDKKR
jgi:predicted PurR-regulated permease PerM